MLAHRQGVVVDRSLGQHIIFVAQRQGGITPSKLSAVVEGTAIDPELLAYLLGIEKLEATGEAQLLKLLDEAQGRSFYYAGNVQISADPPKLLLFVYGSVADGGGGWSFWSNGNYEFSHQIPSGITIAQ